jgi:hypothetical protein
MNNDYPRSPAQHSLPRALRYSTVSRQTVPAATEGFCVCDDRPRRDCGIAEHRAAAAKPASS